jgi:site-specific recombinase XerD
MLRHSFITDSLEDNHDIRTMQEPLGYENVKTTMMYTDVLDPGGHALKRTCRILYRSA